MEKWVAIIVVLLFCVFYTVAIAAQTSREANDAKRTADINRVVAEPGARTMVQHLGFGQRIDVKLKDGSKASGRITGLAGDRFVITNEKGAATAVAYSDVSRITKQREKLGIFHKPWVGIMVTAAGVGTLIVLALQFFD